MSMVIFLWWWFLFKSEAAASTLYAHASHTCSADLDIRLDWLISSQKPTTALPCCSQHLFKFPLPYHFWTCSQISRKLQLSTMTSATHKCTSHKHSCQSDKTVAMKGFCSFSPKPLSHSTQWGMFLENQTRHWRQLAPSVPDPTVHRNTNTI